MAGGFRDILDLLLGWRGAGPVRVSLGPQLMEALRIVPVIVNAEDITTAQQHAAVVVGPKITGTDEV